MNIKKVKRYLDKIKALENNVNLSELNKYKKIQLQKLKNKSESIKLTFRRLNIEPKVFIEKLQDKIEGSFHRDSNQILLKQSKFWVRGITWTLMGTSAFGVIWLSFAKTDEVVVALGKLEPKGGVLAVQMPLEGVAKQILVTEGEEVKKGQLLIQLDTDVSNAQRTALESNYSINKDILDKLSYLVTEGAVSELQYLQQKTKLADLKSQIERNKVQRKYQEIISPEDGIVFELQPKGPGFVARTSEPVLKIVPQTNLQASVEIPSRTIGYVNVGKAVEISIDSYPATDFGVIEGKIIKIGSDALAPNPQQGLGYRFPADISLKNQHLELKNGEKLSLKAGMSLSANIKLRKVSYLKLLFNKFSNRAESLREI